MRTQIKNILEEISCDYEDQAIVLKTYIERLEAPKNCYGCLVAKHDIETNDYTYNESSQMCRDCVRSGWTDNYTKELQNEIY